MIRNRKRAIRMAHAATLCLILMLFAAGFDSPGEELLQDNSLLVIVNDQVELEAISIEDLNRIYLGKKKILAGQNINRLASLESGELHKRFLSTCLHRSHSSFINYWKRMVFTGKGVMPKVFKDEREIVEYVRKHKSAIGYISSSTPHVGVKSLVIQD